MNKLKSFLAKSLKASSSIIGEEVLDIGGKQLKGVFNNYSTNSEFQTGGFEDGPTASFLVSAEEMATHSYTPAIGDLGTLAGRSWIIRDLTPGEFATTLHLGDPDESGNRN